MVIFCQSTNCHICNIAVLKDKQYLYLYLLPTSCIYEVLLKRFQIIKIYVPIWPEKKNILRLFGPVLDLHFILIHILCHVSTHTVVCCLIWLTGRHYEEKGINKVYNKLMQYSSIKTFYITQEKTYDGPCFAMQLFNTGTVFDTEQNINSKTLMTVPTSAASIVWMKMKCGRLFMWPK